MKSRDQICIVAIISLIVLSSACRMERVDYGGDFQLVHEAVANRKNPLYVNINRYPDKRKSLPIGIFDSGTGGLSVLNSILTLDKFNNLSHQEGGDGIPDFISERFLYLADEANMPYGRYGAEDKSDFLQELVLKDVLFLLGKHYYLSPEERGPVKRKEPVKSIVIACNTATAFGLEEVSDAMNSWGLGVDISGIIGAGAKSAVESLSSKDLDRSVVGILATEGTCDSESYPRAVSESFVFAFTDERIKTVQQAGIGLAGAIDGDINYCDPKVSQIRPDDEYFGPGLNNPDYLIDMDLWEEYNFEGGDCLLLAKTDEGEIVAVQLNSITNYVRYMVTHLVNNTINIRKSPSLDVVVLGCTHYPYVENEIRAHFNYLKAFNELYSKIIPDDLILIDPAESLAVSLYTRLKETDLFAENNYENSEFFISVPNPLLADNEIDESGEFPYSWKYGREFNASMEFVKRVPFSDRWIKTEVKERIREDYPICFEIIYSTR